MKRRIRYERHKKEVAKRKAELYDDEQFSDVHALSLREETESVNLTEEESNEEKDVLHTAAVEVLGVNSKAITIHQKMEELDFLKQ